MKTDNWLFDCFLWIKRILLRRAPTGYVKVYWGELSHVYWRLLGYPIPESQDAAHLAFLLRWYGLSDLIVKLSAARRSRYMVAQRGEPWRGSLAHWDRKIRLYEEALLKCDCKSKRPATDQISNRLRKEYEQREADYRAGIREAPPKLIVTEPKLIVTQLERK